MAADTDNAMDMPAHRKTYSKVMAMLKYGAVACFVIAFAVIWLISHK